MSATQMIRLPRRDQPWWFKLCTLPLAALMWVVVALRSWLYDRGVLSAASLPDGTRVISVGNIAVGGTGKTPVVIALAEHLLAAGHRPAILTRGYGSTLSAGDSMALLAGELIMQPGQAASLPDEARLQSVTLPQVPVVVGRDRAAAARRFLVQMPKNLSAPTHWLLDDGFQHRRLKRQKDVVLLDASAPFTNGWLLPSGALRELPAALARADVVLVTRGATVPTELYAALGQVTKAPIFPVPFRVGVPSVAVDGQTRFDAEQHDAVVLVAALARPDQFERDVRALGLNVVHTLWRADHAAFASYDLKAAASKARCIVTTGKDYWRDPSVFTGLAIPVFVLSLKAELSPEALKHSV